MKTEITEQERKEIEWASKNSVAFYPDWTEEEQLSDLRNEFIDGAEFALSELRKPSESETNNFMPKLREYFENTSREDVLKAWDSTKRFDVELTGRTDENCLNLFRKIWERHAIEFKDCDNMPVSRIATNDTAFYNMEEDFATEIAKLLPSSRSQEREVNVELLEAAKFYKTMWLENSEEYTDEENELCAQYELAITNAEKQMKP